MSESNQVLYSTNEISFGLTRRELFAAMAMEGLSAHPTYGNETADWIAQAAVIQADSLIAELARTEKEKPAES